MFQEPGRGAERSPRINARCFKYDDTRPGRVLLSRSRWTSRVQCLHYSSWRWGRWSRVLNSFSGNIIIKNIYNYVTTCIFYMYTLSISWHKKCFNIWWHYWISVSLSSSVAEETEAESEFSCDLSGFDTNPPRVQVYWYYSDFLVPGDTNKYQITIIESPVGATSTLKILNTGLIFQCSS